MTIHMPRLIFLNGPIGVGKSTLISAISAVDVGVVGFSSSLPAVTAVDALLFDENSQTPGWDNPEWRKATPRHSSTSRSHEQLVFDMISFIRTNLGPMYLGNRIREYLPELEKLYETIFISIGNATDYAVITEGRNPQRDFCLIRLHRGDLSYVDGRGEAIMDSRTNECDLENNGTVDDLVQGFLGLFS